MVRGREVGEGGGEGGVSVEGGCTMGVMCVHVRVLCCTPPRPLLLSSHPLPLFDLEYHEQEEGKPSDYTEWTSR